MSDFKKKMKILLVFDSTHPYTTGHYIKSALTDLAIDHHCALPSDVKNAIDDTFDLLLTIDDGSHWLLPADLKIKKAIWIIDTHVSLHHDILMLLDYDYIFCAQRAGMAKLSELGFQNTFWLPLGCDPKVHACHETVSKSYAVGFVGNSGTSERELLLESLREHFADSFIGRANFHEMACIYARSYVAFNKSIRDDLNMRFFEVLCSGTPLVTDYLEDIALLGLDQYVTFYDQDSQIVEKLEKVLENYAEYLERSSDAQYVVMTEHSYKNRIMSLLQTVEISAEQKNNLSYFLNVLKKHQWLRRQFFKKYPNYFILYRVDPETVKQKFKQKIRKLLNV